MKTISKFGAQGDVLFIRVDSLPSGYEAQSHRIVAHSETGHNHEATGGTLYQSKSDLFDAYLVTTGPVQIEHHRSYDTHETMELLYDADEPKGEVVWKIRRQREYTPEGLRRVED